MATPTQQERYPTSAAAPGESEATEAEVGGQTESDLRPPVPCGLKGLCQKIFPTTTEKEDEEEEEDGRLQKQVTPSGSEVAVVAVAPPPTRNTDMLDLDWLILVVPAL